MPGLTAKHGAHAHGDGHGQQNNTPRTRKIPVPIADRAGEAAGTVKPIGTGRPVQAPGTNKDVAVAGPSTRDSVKDSHSQDELIEIPDVIHDSSTQKTYSRGRFLGKGGFARCYEVTEHRTREVFACKVVSKSLLKKQHQREKMAQEISIHRELDHDFVVKFFSYFEDDLNVYIILELCTRKSLMEMQKRRRTLLEPEVRYFIRQIMTGIFYLHDRKIIHRDLKLGNIYITEQMVLKLGDFGLATQCDTSASRKYTLCGTPNYIAPEVLIKKGHSFEVDIWAVGCIMYTLLLGTPPFETRSLKETYGKIKKGEYTLPTGKISNTARGLLTQMLQVDPALRPSAIQVLESDFLTKSFIPMSLPLSCLTMHPRITPSSTGADGSTTGNRIPRAWSRFTDLVDKKPQVMVPRAKNAPATPVPANPGPPTEPLVARPKLKQIQKAVFKPPEPLQDKKPQQVMVSRPPTEPWVERDKMKQVTAGHMRDLLTQMKYVMAAIGKRPNKAKFNDESEDPNSAPMMWIAKWVDYSDKYGFGYQLSDDSIGVSYNDTSKMLLVPDNNHFQYIDRTGQEHFYTKDRMPTELIKKLKLLNYFQQYMTENLIKAGGESVKPDYSMTRLPSMWTWFRTSRAVVMVLTNGTLQINNFRDHTKTILCPLLSAITTLEADKPMKTYKFSYLQTHGCTPELADKICYAIEKLEVVLGSKLQKNIPSAVRDPAQDPCNDVAVPAENDANSKKENNLGPGQTEAGAKNFR